MNGTGTDESDEGGYSDGDPYDSDWYNGIHYHDDSSKDGWPNLAEDPDVVAFGEMMTGILNSTASVLDDCIDIPSAPKCSRFGR